MTGAKGFVGRNLVENLKNIRDGKNRTRPNLRIEEVFESDLDTNECDFKYYLRQADFIFYLAGVNRPEEKSEFMIGNCDSLKNMLAILEELESKASIMISSSTQATLSGRFENSEYGRSKLAAEDVLFAYGDKHSTEVFVFRFPGLFGKWCRPNYNSVVATFCDAMANEKEYKISDPGSEIELAYIDDAVECMIDLLEGKVKYCSFDGANEVYSENGKTEEARFAYLPKRYKVRLGEIESLLLKFKEEPKRLFVPGFEPDSFEKKLYATYLSYLTEDNFSYVLPMKSDDRGSFTELIKSDTHGQISLNICKPGMTKGIHWHNLKCEIFIVISGEGIIRERKIGSEEVIDKKVCGDKPEAVYMLPGYTHSIENVSSDNNLMFIVWADELFDENKPDTYREEL